MTLLAREGDPAPGGAGANYSSFSEPTLNAAGKTAFRATLTGPGITSANNTGIWSGVPGSVTLLARTGDPAPGTAPGVNYSSFGGLLRTTLNVEGQTAFAGYFLGPGVTADNNNYAAVWMGAPGAVVLLARGGDPAFIPIFGGSAFGLADTFWRGKGEISSRNLTDALSGRGQTGFTAAGQFLRGRISGEAIAAFECGGRGLALDSGAASLGINGGLNIEKGLVEVIPKAKLLEDNRVIGRAVKWLNRRAKLTCQIAPFVELTGTFEANAAGDLEFADVTASWGTDSKSTLQIDVTDGFSAKTWVAGRGSGTVGPNLGPGQAIRAGSDVGVPGRDRA